MSMSKPPHLMIVDPYASGHHGYYIEVLCRRWVETWSEGRLSVVVNTNFRAVHGELAAWIDGENPRIGLIETSFIETHQGGLWSLIRTDLTHGRALAEIASRLRPDRLILMYFDHFQASLAFDLRFSHYMRIAGIYFRPSFHYPYMFGTRRSRRERSRDGLKRMLLRLACRNRHLDSVFSLDPFLPSYPGISSMRARFIPLAEPTPILNLENTAASGIKTISLVGSLARRKGVVEFLEAVSLLPDELTRDLQIVLAGPIADDLLAPVQDWVDVLNAKGISIEITDRILNDSEVESIIAQSHLVVLPYQRHIGMSNPLVRSAKYAKPVLGPEFGLLGALIDRHGLGMTVDTANPQAIMRGLATFLDPGIGFPFEPEAARTFAGDNTATAFADTILQQTRS